MNVRSRYTAVRHWLEARLRVLAVTLTLATVAGCQAANDGSVPAEPPVRRYDIVQSLSAHNSTVVAGTQTGALLTSVDGGKNWARKDIGPHSFIAIASCPDGSFFAADFYHNVLPIAADGAPGKALELQDPGTPLAVACDPQGRWWVVGTFSTLAMSADQGATWTVQEFGEDAHLTTLQFIDSANAVMVGEFGLMFTSTDGGATWQRGPALSNEFYPYSAHFASATDGWVSGIAGLVLHTTDGGTTWTREANESGTALYRLFVTGGRLHGVGASGVVARGDDGIWRALTADKPLPAFAGTAVPVDDAVVVGGVGTPVVLNLATG